MAHPNPRPASSEGDELVITRVFDAPRRLVWQAWTEPARFMRWWGPAGFTAPAATIDLRVGGTIVACMRGPDGGDVWTVGTYRLIDPPTRLEFDSSFADAAGNAVRPTHYGFGDDFPPLQRVTVTFDERDGKTTMVLRQSGLPAGAIRSDTDAGWNQSFDKLAASLGDI